MRTTRSPFLLGLALGLSAAVAAAPAIAQEPPPSPSDDGAKAAPAKDDDPILAALEAELGRSIENLRDKESDPLYYLSYRVEDERTFSMSASYGALTDPGPSVADAGRSRTLDVACRVGSHELDNTHKLRGEWSWGGFGNASSLPLGDDVAAMRVSIWRATDSAYKDAVRQLIRIRTNEAVKVEAEDKADDFSREKPHVHLGPRLDGSIDTEEWKGRLQRLSARFKAHPLILSSQVGISGGVGTQYFVDSDGARIREPQRYYRITIYGAVKADDGMDLDLFDSIEAISPEQLPTEEDVAKKVDALIAQLHALRDAPVVEPFAGPAIIMNRAAAVFFHEIFGHRIEGHRQKDEDEGQTFTKKVGKSIMPEFMSIADDPTQAHFGDIVLNGQYDFDEEGQPGQRVQLVDKGVLRNFLMGRSPIDNFPHSNGHGRAQAGLPTVARQGNLLVSSTNKVPFAKLREMLIEEVKRQGKDHGLMFQDIAGGFTFTGRGMPQAFKVTPLVVYRVYPDGRPDELVRGVDLVGTPLTSLEKILATADDDAVFNGYCGAESGWVPVSAVSPSLLVAQMEVEKKSKNYERPPILPPPLHEGVEWPGTDDETGGGQ